MKKIYFFLILIISWFLNLPNSYAETESIIVNPYFSFEYPDSLSLDDSLFEDWIYSYKFISKDSRLKISIENIISNKKITYSIIKKFNKSWQGIEKLSDKRYDNIAEWYSKKINTYYSISWLKWDITFPIHIELIRGNILLIIEGDLKKDKALILSSLWILESIKPWDQPDTNEQIVSKYINTNISDEWIFILKKELFYGCHVGKDICFNSFYDVESWSWYSDYYISLTEDYWSISQGYRDYGSIQKDFITRNYYKLSWYDNSLWESRVIELENVESHKINYVIISDFGRVFIVSPNTYTKWESLDFLNYIKLVEPDFLNYIEDLLESPSIALQDSWYEWEIDSDSETEILWSDVHVEVNWKIDLTFNAEKYSEFAYIYTVDSEWKKEYYQTIYPEDSVYKSTIPYKSNLKSLQLEIGTENGIYSTRDINLDFIEEIIGIGVKIMDSRDWDNPVVSITDTIPWTPAEKMWLERDDIIQMVDGEIVTNTVDASRLIRGEKDTKVELLIKRWKSTFKVELIRESLIIENNF